MIYRFSVMERCKSLPHFDLTIRSCFMRLWWKNTYNREKFRFQSNYQWIFLFQPDMLFIWFDIEHIKTHRQLNRIHINFKQKTKNGIVSLIVRDVCIKTLQHDIFQEHTWLFLSIFYDKNILHYLWPILNENVRVELMSKYT